MITCKIKTRGIYNFLNLYYTDEAIEKIIQEHRNDHIISFSIPEGGSTQLLLNTADIEFEVYNPDDWNNVEIMPINLGQFVVFRDISDKVFVEWIDNIEEFKDFIELNKHLVEYILLKDCLNKIKKEEPNQINVDECFKVFKQYFL